MGLNLAELKSGVSQIVGETLNPLKSDIEAMKKEILDLKGRKFSETTTEYSEDLSFSKYLTAIVTGNTKVAGKALAPLIEGTSSTGGYLVPPQFVNKIDQIVVKYGYARKLCTKIPMKSNTVQIPKLTSNIAMSMIGENASMSDTKPAFGQTTLTAQSGYVLVPVSKELLADSGPALDNYLMRLMGWAIAKGEDTQLFTGNGTAPNMTGLLSDSASTAGVNQVAMDTGDTSFADINLDYILEMTNNIVVGSEDNAAFFFHRDIMKYLRQLKDSMGRYVLQPPTAGNPGTLWGYPYYIVNVLPGMASDAANKRFIAFGDLSYVYFGQRQGLQFEVAKEATVDGVNLFANNLIAIRVIERFAIQIAMPNAFAVLKTAAS